MCMYTRVCLRDDIHVGCKGERIHPYVYDKNTCVYMTEKKHKTLLALPRASPASCHFILFLLQPFPFSLLLWHLQTDKSRINVSGHFLLQRQSPQPLVIQGGSCKNSEIDVFKLLASGEREGRAKGPRVCWWGGEGGWRVANGGGDSNNDACLARNGLTQCYHPPHLTAPSPPTAPPCLKTSRKVETEAILVRCMHNCLQCGC